MDYIYFRAGRVRPGGGGQIFFFFNLRSDYFFFQMGGVGTWGVLTNIYFMFIFSFNGVASLDYICLQVGIVRPGVGYQG